VARPEKVQAVKDIKQKLEEAEAVFLTEYAGLTVGQQQQLRRGLRAGHADYRVVKMSLTRLAADELKLGDEFTVLLTGPTAIAFADDPAVAAKALAEFGKEHEALKVKGMLLAGELLPPEKVAELAKLDSRDVMLSKVAGIIQAPMANMAGLMAAFTRNAANMFLQLEERKAEEAPPAEEPAQAAVEAEAATSEEPDIAPIEGESQEAEGAPAAEPIEVAAEDAQSEETSSDESGGEEPVAEAAVVEGDLAPQVDAADQPAANDSDSEEEEAGQDAASDEVKEENNDG